MTIPDSCALPTWALAATGGLLALAGLLALLALRPRRAAMGARLRPLLALGGAGLVLGAGTGLFAAARHCPAPVPQACLPLQITAETNLLANPALAAGTTITDSLPTWIVSGTLSPGAPAAWIAPTAGSTVQSAHMLVRPGARYCVEAQTAGSGHVQVLVRWQDATLKDRLADTAPAPRPASDATFAVEAVAPPGAAYAQVWLRALDGSPRFSTPVFAQQGVRVDPWPNGARAALAFSFDWETAMGGLIHSKSQHDLNYAVTRGRAMREGADLLLGLFTQHGIQATFYANGYNLLDGNPTHRAFAGNPIYKYGPANGGWHTTWWLTNTWYSDDPYGTIASNPEWYFGDQTDRLVAGGQEIGSHTFGHLYVRGTKVLSFTTDLDEWAAAARARPTPLPPVRTFAFPWESSNSLTADFYAVMARHGITSVTRLYPPDLRDRYVISAVPIFSSTLIMPDLLLGAAGQNLSEGGDVDVAGGLAGRSVLSNTVARRGVTSFWTHPEQLTVPGVRAAWEDVIVAAAAARDRGDLWIAPVGTITQRWRDMSLLDVTPGAGAPEAATTVLTNRSPDALDGITLTLPGPAGAIRIDGSAATANAAGQIVLRSLAPGAVARIEVDSATSGRAR